MVGDDRTRHCSQCNLNVYNLSSMTALEAEELVSRREGRMCVRFYRRNDGTMLTQNCPVGLKVVMRRVSRVAGIALSAVMSTVPLAAQIQPRTQAQVVEGDTGLDIEVIDVQGAVCAGARVELSKGSSQQTITVTTNDEGVARLAHLHPGTYELTVTFPGFEPHNQTVNINERETLVLKASLDVGATQGEIVEPTVLETHIAEPPPIFLESVPVSEPRSSRAASCRRALSKLIHPWR
jgi:hypothetical protein